MNEPTPITAAMLYDYVKCPHRVAMDLYAPTAQRDPVSPFTQLLWEKGALYEQALIESLELPFVNLLDRERGENARLTLEAMQRGEPLIYAGRIEGGDLLGIPDLLRREGDGYLPGDIKSGSGEEGPDDARKLKKHYGVQLALYVDILERLGLSAGRRGFIWDVHGEEVAYDLTAPKGPKSAASLWDDYREALEAARQIVSNRGNTSPAYGSVCKECHWYSTCLDAMQADRDLTLIPELGRTLRNTMADRLADIPALAKADPEAFIESNKTVFPGLGPDRLRRFHERARLVAAGGAPYLRQPFDPPELEPEVFFDLEYDPMREVCYLHGFLERRGGDNDTERFVHFFADDPTPEAEERAFAEAVDYLRNLQPCALYFYSKYERTICRQLQARYPAVINEEALEALFDPARSVDLYNDVVKKHTEWPTRDHSIKTLARYLGFQWRDTDPSGAASIEWFHRWVETGDPDVRQRIIDYNEDDCRATRVLLDGIRALPVRSPD